MGASSLVAKHLSPDEVSATTVAALSKLLCECFPDDSTPTSLSDLVGFYSEDCCHWLLVTGQSSSQDVGGSGSPDLAETGSINACVCLAFLGEAMFVHALAVRPSHRRQGIAATLLVEAQKLAIRLGAKRLEGTVDVFGKDAAHLQLYYEALGGVLVKGAGFGPAGLADVTQLRFRKAWPSELTEDALTAWLCQVQARRRWRMLMRRYMPIGLVAGAGVLILARLLKRRAM